MLGQEDCSESHSRTDGVACLTSTGVRPSGLRLTPVNAQDSKPQLPLGFQTHPGVTQRGLQAAS